MNSLVHLSFFAALVATALARWGAGGPCSRDDKMCMSQMGTKYTNMVRAKKNVGPLEDGSIYMLNNAFAHSLRMARGAPFDHQPIRRGVMVAKGQECEAMLSGENIAQDNVPFSGPANPAKICVDAWEGSQGHYENMMRTDQLNTVVGIYVGSDDRIWCTQTFTRKTTRGGAMCEKAVMGSKKQPMSTKEEAPTPKPEVMVVDPMQQMEMEKKRMEKADAARKKKAMEMAEKKRRQMAEDRTRKMRDEKRMSQQEAMEKKPMDNMMKPMTEMRKPMPRMKMLKHRYFIVKNKYGRRSYFVQRCNKRTGTCRFCRRWRHRSCYSVGASRYFDNMLTRYGL